MNTLNKIIGGIAVLALVLSIIGLVGNKQPVPVSFGGTTNFDALTLDNGDLSLTKGNVVISNTATSSVTVGKIQTYATSSATTICLGFNTQATTTVAGRASNGMVLWYYGSCL